jgi:branched-chain amino acid transport system substrate-binding protein
VDRAGGAELLGDPNPASGEPVLVGMENLIGGTAIDNTPERDAAKAATTYVNEYLGGLGGRPIRMTFCDGQTSADAAANCATEFIQEGVDIVVAGYADSAFSQVIIAAGVPYVVTSPVTSPELVSPRTTFALTGGVPSFVGAAARAAEEADVSSLTMFILNTPGRPEAFASFASAFESVGVDFTSVAVDRGTADMTPQVAAASDSEAFWIVGDPPFCVAALQAIETLGVDKPVFIHTSCNDASVVAALANGLDGYVVVGLPSNFDAEDPEAALYFAVLDRYAPDIEPLGLTTGGYISVVALARVMDGFSGRLSPAAVDGHIKGAGPIPLPLAGGVDFDCGKPAVSTLPAVCNMTSFIVTLDHDGNAARSVTAPDVAQLLGN